jgi:2'-5' RNA ligase
MGYAIELNLSRKSRTLIDKIWERLSIEKIATTMIDIDAQPHISLAVFDSIDCEIAQKVIKSFAKETNPLSVKLSFVGTFPTRENVVFIAPKVTTELLNIHLKLHEKLSNKGIKSIEYYQPNNWIPHCTIAIDLNKNKTSKVIDICLQSKAFEFVVLDEVSLIEFRPVRNIISYKLAPS